MEILNKTQRPLKIALPGGKKLHLGPGKTGQITPKAAAHPPVQKLVESGDLEIVDSGKTKSSSSGSGQKGPSAAQGHNPSGGVRHTGDR